MKVRELIKMLEDLDEEMEVKHYSPMDSEYTNVDGVAKIEVGEFKCYMIY